MTLPGEKVVKGEIKEATVSKICALDRSLVWQENEGGHRGGASHQCKQGLQILPVNHVTRTSQLKQKTQELHQKIQTTETFSLPFFFSAKQKCRQGWYSENTGIVKVLCEMKIRQ